MIKGNIVNIVCIKHENMKKAKEIRQRILVDRGRG
jgi:hypothetical protein